MRTISRVVAFVVLATVAGPVSAFPPATSVKLRPVEAGVLTPQEKSAGLLFGSPGVRLYGKSQRRNGRAAMLYIGVPGRDGERLFRLEHVVNWSGSRMPVGCIARQPGDTERIMSVTLDLDVVIPGPSGVQEVVLMQYSLTWPEQHPHLLSAEVTGRANPIVWRAPRAEPLPDCLR
ncbi:hypothetical protein [Brevundimonas aurantiaca]|jgi:hypothetical protein|uniref:Uncharacterized protein n=1 Tax=Brevundimonas aurantiaca TaxID=74316 RepID=A0A7W9C3B1_9CAUL|nr:hypothetical protein [Brevundimonas aurantiaca]MBB5738316.1 hypothetical protein [Brevundimonas aurantiaca]